MTGRSASGRRTDAIERALAGVVPDWLSPTLVRAIVAVAMVLTLALVGVGILRIEQAMRESRTLGRCILAQSAEVHDAPSLSSPGIENLRNACEEWMDSEALMPPPPP